MNVEQLIEDGWKQHKKTFEEMYWGDDCRAAGEEGFALGVRYAIAAMFPVCAALDLNFPELDERHIWVKRPNDPWRLGQLLWDREESVMCVSCEWWGKDRIVFEAEEEAIEMRACLSPDELVCPTPGEMGMGGV